MDQKSQKAVIWDMDGVIADTGPFHYIAWQVLSCRKGRAFSEQDFQHSFGRRNDDILKFLFGNLTPKEIESLAEQKEEIFRSAARGNIRAFPGVSKLLEIQRKNGFKIALGSSAPVENVKLILSSLGIAGYFDAMVSSKDVKKGKPDPEVFLIAAEKLGVAPSRCIVIEDAIPGVEAAKAAGMKCIAVTNTNHPKALAKADHVTDNLEKIGSEDLHQLLAG